MWKEIVNLNVVQRAKQWEAQQAPEDTRWRQGLRRLCIMMKSWHSHKKVEQQSIVSVCEFCSIARYRWSSQWGKLVLTKMTWSVWIIDVLFSGWDIILLICGVQPNPGPPPNSQAKRKRIDLWTDWNINNAFDLSSTAADMVCASRVECFLKLCRQEYLAAANLYTAFQKVWARWT